MSGAASLRDYAVRSTDGASIVSMGSQFAIGHVRPLARELRGGGFVRVTQRVCGVPGHRVSILELYARLDC